MLRYSQMTKSLFGWFSSGFIPKHFTQLEERCGVQPVEKPWSTQLVSNLATVEMKSRAAR
jgi:hypothetical protein